MGSSRAHKMVVRQDARNTWYSTRTVRGPDLPGALIFHAALDLGHHDSVVRAPMVDGRTNRLLLNGAMPPAG